MNAEELFARRGTVMAIAAGFGLMFGLLWFQGQPLGLVAGVLAGLLLGAIIEYQWRRQHNQP